MKTFPKKLLTLSGFLALGSVAFALIISLFNSASITGYSVEVNPEIDYVGFESEELIAEELSNTRHWFNATVLNEDGNMSLVLNMTAIAASTSGTCDLDGDMDIESITMYAGGEYEVEELEEVVYGEPGLYWLNLTEGDNLNVVAEVNLKNNHCPLALDVNVKLSES